MHCVIFSSLQISTRQLLTGSLLLSLFLPTLLATCSSDNDCLLGTCDDQGYCRCGLNCRVESYFQHVICSERTCTNSNNGTRNCVPVQSVCFEAEEECSSSQLFDFKRLTRLQFDLLERDCNRVLRNSGEYPTERFCEDQSYCSGNGICVQNVETKNTKCICNDQHEGERCDDIRPSASTFSVSQLTLFKEYSKKKYSKTSIASKTASSSTFVIALAVLASPCMVIGFIFIKRQRRRKSELMPIKTASDYETENAKLTIKNIPTKNLCKQLSSRNDYVQEVLPYKTYSVLSQAKDISTVISLCDENDYLIGTNL